MKDNEKYKSKAPCLLCHFCVKTDLETHGSICVWYDTYLPQSEVGESDAPFREMCRHDKQGDSFTWRMTGVGALDYVRWKQSLIHLNDVRTRASVAVAISVLSIIFTMIKFVI